MQETAAHGVAQTVHCLVASRTDDTDAELLRECLLRLLVAPEPLNMRKVVHVCAAGAAGAATRRLVADLQSLGARATRQRCKVACRDRRFLCSVLTRTSANVRRVCGLAEWPTWFIAASLL